VAILRAVGLSFKSLFPTNGGGQAYSRTSPLTVAELAAHKRLPESFLRETFKVRDGDRGVVIPYFKTDGSLSRERLRSALRAKDGSSWLPGNGQALYGADRLAGYRLVSKILFLVEGESDVWAGAFHSLPMAGIPGADAAKVLGEEHIAEFTEIYFIR
jgi:putative DNA primase/helicase